MDANNGPTSNKLRLITYLSPGIPLGLFQIYQHYLEDVLKMESYLMVESRWSGPPMERTDPFTTNEADIGFMCSSPFLRLRQEKNQFAEFLPVSPIHIHDKNDLRPIYYGDVIMHKSKSEDYKLLSDLKGHRWAFNDEMSVSGNIAVLADLKKLGYNSSFFGHILRSGSHHASIQMVLDNRVDAAAIDSCVLQNFLQEHPQYKKELFVLCHIGPLPIPPVIVNSRLPAEMKQKIAQAFLDMNKSEEMQKRLGHFGVWGFKKSDVAMYDSEVEINEIVKGLSIRSAYY